MCRGALSPRMTSSLVVVVPFLSCVCFTGLGRSLDLEELEYYEGVGGTRRKSEVVEVAHQPCVSPLG
jgi:hypothetical protein